MRVVAAACRRRRRGQADRPRSFFIADRGDERPTRCILRPLRRLEVRETSSRRPVPVRPVLVRPCPATQRRCGRRGLPRVRCARYRQGRHGRRQRRCRTGARRDRDAGRTRIRTRVGNQVASGDRALPTGTPGRAASARARRSSADAGPFPKLTTDFGAAAPTLAKVSGALPSAWDRRWHRRSLR